MNTISRTGIEGFDYTWNPVVGCLNGCPYCWARRVCFRFSGDWAAREAHARKYPGGYEVSINRLGYEIQDFRPTFLEYQFAKSFPKKPGRIIVGWMSDIAYWQPEWMERVLGKIREYPQHTFFFLTKKPEVYQERVFPDNCWMGTTVTKREAEIEIPSRGKRFLSIEPLLGDLGEITLSYLGRKIGWIIIGAQTGPGEKVIPRREWVEAIINQAKELKIPVYLKDNLLKAVPGLPRLKEIPQ